jgi:hypothetical protein
MSIAKNCMGLTVLLALGQGIPGASAEPENISAALAHAGAVPNGEAVECHRKRLWTSNGWKWTQQCGPPARADVHCRRWHHVWEDRPGGRLLASVCDRR